MEGNSVARFKEIAKVFTQYGLGYLLEVSDSKKVKKSPSNLRSAFEELGPTFIKIGQILSTRPEFMNEEYIVELSKLQDKVPIEDFDIMSNVFFLEFNKKIEDVFLFIDKKPIASASIAQVYRGILKDGRDVVVKIQRPNIKENLVIDFDILIGLSQKAKPVLKNSVVDVKEVLEEVKESTEKELDFTIESENIKKFREYNKDIKCVYAPYVIDEISGHSVMTLENIQGFKINNLDTIEALGYDREDIGKKFALSYFKQVLKDGYFHGDPHPGNILISGGKICFIDFGIVGEISKEKRKNLNNAIEAIANEDIDKLTDFVLSIGIKIGKVNREMLYKDIDYIFKTYYSTSLKNIKVAYLFQEVLTAAKRNNIRIASDFTMLIRTMVIVEGLVAELAPEINLIELIIPYVKGFYMENFFRDFNKDDYLIKGYKLGKDTIKIPSKFVEVSDTFVKGRTKITLAVEDSEKYICVLNKMVNRLAFSLVIAGMVIASSIIININAEPKVYGVSLIGIAGYFVSAVFGLWLLISIIRSGSLK